MLEKLKNELLGEEFNILDFDNKMENLNFYSEYDAYTEELLESGVIMYLSKKDNETHVRIEFNVTMENSNSEDIRSSYIRILDIN